MKWIACRILTSGLHANAARVEVRIGEPEIVEPGEWRCAFGVGDGTRPIEYAYGIDAMQAILMAFAAIRQRVESDFPGYSVEGVSPDVGSDHGIPAFIPQSLGVDFTRKMERLIEREIARAIPMDEGQT